MLNIKEQLAYQGNLEDHFDYYIKLADSQKSSAQVQALIAIAYALRLLAIKQIDD